MAFDRLEAMRAFCRIVEVGSFSRAAESLGLAKTTVSGQLQALENLLGIRLLHRTTRKVTTTTEGAAYYQRARAILEDVNELEASASQSCGAVRGRVKIEMPSPVGILLVVPALPDFVARYPDIVLDVRCSERVVDLVQEGVDCAIRGGHIADQDLVCRAIGLMRFTLCAAPSYLDAAPPLQSPSDIARHRHLGFRFPATDRRYVPVLTRGDEQFALDPVPAMYFNSGSASAAAVVAGLGVTFLPKAEAEPHVQAGRLVEVLPDWQMGSMPMSFVYPPTRALSARVRAVPDWVTGLMAANPVWAPPP